MHPLGEPAKGVQSLSSKGWGAAPITLFLLVPPLTAPALLMGCKPDKPTAPGSNILLTKRKRKYVRLLLSSGVGGCYRTRWFKLVFHLPGWWENTACLTTSTATAALPIDGWQWFQGAVAPSESRGPKAPAEIWDSYPTVSGLGAGSNISRSEPWWFQQESLAVIFKQGPRPHHQHHPTYWIRNSVAGMGSSNLRFFISPPDNSDAHLSLWTTGLEKRSWDGWSMEMGVSGGKWVALGSNCKPLGVLLFPKYTEGFPSFCLVRFF